MPSHTHTAQADAGGGGNAVPTSNSWGASGGRGRPAAPYAPSSNSNVAMSQTGTSFTGGSLPHNNMQPYLCMTFIIALQGIFPPRT
jgi:microcystin-dependent protein